VTVGFRTLGDVFISETAFIATGNSAGWLGTIAGSPFVKRQQDVLVPAGAGKIRVSLTSTGLVATVGIMVIDDLTVAVHPSTILAGNIFPNPTFEEGDQLDNPAAALPAGIWQRGGNGSLDQVSTGNSVSPTHSLSLLDNSERDYGEWYGFLTLSGIVPGDVLDLQWFQLYSVSNGGPMRLTFAFTDANNGQLESHDYNVNGDSPGWQGSVATSPFEQVNRRLLVPDGTVKLRVNLASGGASSVTGTMVIDNLSVALSKPRLTELVPQVGGFDLTWDSVPGKTYTVRFASTLGSPPIWTALATGLASGGLTTTYSDTTVHPGNTGLYQVIQE
jgi:hypothetical protein